jgi:ring-1,2-phenylacetyl-CoA epoxidase subunit PaaE
MLTATAFIRGWFSEPAPTFELRKPSARWGSTRPQRALHQLRVVEVIDETPSTRSFVLACEDDAPAFDYRAGQHLTLHVAIDGVTHHRCYSYSTSPAAGNRPAITVKRVASGIVSQHLHDRVRAGDVLVASEPTGHFILATDATAARTLVMVAGGVGITPLASIAETVLREEPQSRVVLLTGNRSESEIIFRERMALLAAEFAPRLDVRHAVDLSSPGWTGITGALTGQRVLEALAQVDADQYFVCGPEAMMQGVCEALATAGIDSERIHTERFAYATANATQIPAHAAEIKFAASGRRVTARPGQTILQAGLEAGLDLPYSCTMGGCGACKVKKSSGSVVAAEPNCLTDREREEGYVLACCSYADGSLTIENH